MQEVTNPAIYGIVAGQITHAYEVQTRPPYNCDICYSIMVTTKEPITFLIVNETKLPVEKIDHNTYATIDPFEARRTPLQITKDDSMTISVLCIFLERFRYDKPESELKLTTKADLFKYFDLPVPQPWERVTKGIITDGCGWLPELADLVAEYYNPYKQTFKFVKLEKITDISLYPIPKIAGVRYPVGANVSMNSLGIEILPPRDSLLSRISGGYVTTAFGPCDLRFIGYNPEDQNIAFIKLSNRYNLQLSIEPKCSITFILVD